MIITLEITEDQAWDFSQYLKRIGYSEYRASAASEEEAYRMVDAGNAVRDAFARAGIVPR